MLPTDVVRVVAGIALTLLVGWVGWSLNGWRLSGSVDKAKKDLANYKAVATAAALKKSEEYRVLEEKHRAAVAVAQKAYLELVKNAQDKEQSFQAGVANGSVRLFVNARCPALGELSGDPAGGGGVDAGKPELDPAARSGYFALRREIIKEQLKVKGLQGYINSLPSVCGPSAK